MDIGLFNPMRSILLVLQSEHHCLQANLVWGLGAEYWECFMTKEKKQTPFSNTSEKKADMLQR